MNKQETESSDRQSNSHAVGQAATRRNLVSRQMPTNTDYRDGKTGIKRSHCDNNNNKTQLAYYCNHFLKWGQSMKQKYPLSKQQMIVINNW